MGCTGHGRRSGRNGRRVELQGKPQPMSMSLYSSRAMAAAAPLRLHATMTAPHHAPFLLLQRMLYRRPTLNPLKTFLVPAPRTFSSSAMAPQRIGIYID